jgi:hypothetical protein
MSSLRSGGPLRMAVTRVLPGAVRSVIGESLGWFVVQVAAAEGVVLVRICLEPTDRVVLR